MDLGAMAMKGCSAFPKAPELQEPHHQIFSCHIQDTNGDVSVFYNPSRLGNQKKKKKRQQQTTVAKQLEEINRKKY